MRWLEGTMLTRKEAIALFQNCMTNENRKAVEKVIRVVERSLSTTSFLDKGIYEFCAEEHHKGEQRLLEDSSEKHTTDSV